MQLQSDSCPMESMAMINLYIRIATVGNIYTYTGYIFIHIYIFAYTRIYAFYICFPVYMFEECVSVVCTYAMHIPPPQKKKKKKKTSKSKKANLHKQNNMDRSYYFYTEFPVYTRLISFPRQNLYKSIGES